MHPSPVSCGGRQTDRKRRKQDAHELWEHLLLFEALFILTTIDAGTRVARYLVQEMVGVAYKPMGNLNWWPGVIVASLAVVFAWGYLIANGSIGTIWPMFGVANQLLGMLALCVAPQCSSR